MFSKRHMRRLIKNEESEFYGMAEDYSEEDAVNCSEFYGMAENNSEEDAMNCSFDNIDAEVEFIEKEESSQKTNCDKLIEKLKMWTARHKVTRSCFDDLLKILQSENISVPTSSKGVLRQATCRLRTVAPGNYLHIGLEKQLRSIAITLSDVDKFEIDVGIDGLPLYKSSNVSLWPILAKLHPKRNTKVMLIGVFEGKQKPADVNNYLHDFAYELKTLTQYGMEVNGRRIKVKVRCFICDAPARAFICQTVGHTSFQGCSKCTQVGKKINNTITYSTLTENLRTDDDFAARNSVGHHKKMEKSCLEEMGVGMVSAFPVEPMHLLDLGVVRKMLKCLINGPNVGYQLTKQQKNMLSKTLISYIPYIPSEFARKPRNLDEIARWKAIEFRQFVLYTGIVALKDIVSDGIYYHFSLLHCAYALLSSQKTYQNNLEEIKQMLNYFVHLFPTFYGEEKVSYNVHSVLHLVDSVQSCARTYKMSYHGLKSFSVKSVVENYENENSCSCKIANLEKKVDEMQQHIEKLTKQVDTTNELLRKLTTVQSTNNALINAMSCRRKSTNKFPLKTDEALKDLDTELEGNKEKYINMDADMPAAPTPTTRSAVNVPRQAAAAVAAPRKPHQRRLGVDQ
ncbi:uncharacterized protein LOC125779722 [Bactrocera dorsalis]|uniref:Uncharacterized protein LOC125779722 n=1 Tax=Bactrocera dorsalis TaxID=27457 RepID=A0ABM3K648_BACDO|nr:uncharacterized protein LOC125779722 [Bactrocera dorsalis]